MNTNLAKTSFSVYRTNNDDVKTFFDVDGNYSVFNYINFISGISWTVGEFTNIEDAIKIAKKKKKETNYFTAYFYIVTNNKSPQVIAIF